MTAPAIRGWCPGALRPMLSGDGWLVRVRPPGGRLTAAQAAGLAAAAARHGNGMIDLSSRAGLQLRGVREGAHGALVDDLAALGLVETDLAAEAARNLVVTPFWTAGDGTLALAGAMAAGLAAVTGLPGKFGGAVDTGAAPVLTGAPADIRLERDGTGRLLLRPDGYATGIVVADGSPPPPAPPHGGGGEVPDLGRAPDAGVGMARTDDTGSPPPPTPALWWGGDGGGGRPG